MDLERENRRKFIVCNSDTCSDIRVSVPVEIHARADVDGIDLRCMGCTVEMDDDNNDRDRCRFKIVQRIHARIPVRCFCECETEREDVDIEINDCDR